MKRFLLILSLVISGFLIALWEISSFETLPNHDTSWHQLKRKISMKLLSFKKDPYANDHIPLSAEKIDIVILASEADLNILPFTIDAAKGLIMHPINKVYLICPESEKLRSIALAKGCEFIAEAKVLPEFLSTQLLTPDLKQQYLKLNADSVTEPGIKYYLVIDAKTVLLQTQVFLKNGKQVLNAVNHYNLEYKQNTELVLKIGKYMNFSFNSCYMLFDKQILKNIKNHIEKLHNQSWQNALQICSQNLCANEIYANYMLAYHANKTAVVYEKNAQLPLDKLVGVEWQRGFLGRHYKSVSFNN